MGEKEKKKSNTEEYWAVYLSQVSININAHL